MNLPEDERCPAGSWCETLIMFACVLLGLFTLTYCNGG